MQSLNVSRVSNSPEIRGVIFDVGGVVITSPLIAIAAYEREKGLPRDWINVLITGYGEQGAWQRFERGELDLSTFYGRFGEELSNVENGRIWYAEYCSKRSLEFPKLPAYEEMKVEGRELFGRMMRNSKFDPIVVNAIHKIRATNRFRIISVTNNFGQSTAGIEASELKFLGWEGGAASTSPQLVQLFDDYIDSSVVGLRKPDPAIYRLACARNDLKPEEVVMLDDLKMTASQLGMRTIQVRIGRSDEAMRELGRILGLELVDDGKKGFKL